MTTLEFCIDCTQYAHGISAHDRGEDYPTATIEAFNDSARSLNEATPGTVDHAPACYFEGELSQVDDCECEQITFTWSRCDACLSPLGGSRSLFTLDN